MKKYNKYLSHISMVGIHAENAKSAQSFDFKTLLSLLKGLAVIKNEALMDAALTDSQKDTIEYIAEKSAFHINEVFEGR